MLSDYELIFFDADNTLLDYSSAERQSFFTTIRYFGFPGDEIFLFHTFKKENSFLWYQFEKGKISPHDLLLKRWQILLDRLYLNHLRAKKISDFYTGCIIKCIKPMPYAVELCESLQNKTNLVIITNGFAGTQQEKLRSSELEKYFSHVVTSEAIGEPKPSPKIFSHAHEPFKDIPKSKILMVGDNFNADINGAHHYGIDSCYFSKRGARPLC